MESDRRSESPTGMSHPLYLKDCTVRLGIQGRTLRLRTKGMKSYKYMKGLLLRGWFIFTLDLT